MDTTTDNMTKPHQGCSCSRNRKCAFYAGQIKQMQKVAKPVIDAHKVTMGIEELRARSLTEQCWKATVSA